MNKKLQDNLKIFDKVSKNEEISGYFLVAISKDESGNKGFYYTFNGDEAFDLLGLVGTVQDLLKQRAAEYLSDDVPVSSLPDINSDVGNNLQ